jgi:hydroxylamine reductase (hybrid-cluster protein)
MRCHKCENSKNSKCRIVYNTPVFMKQQNIASQIVSRNMREQRLNQNACDAIMLKGEALKAMTEDAVRFCLL